LRLWSAKHLGDGNAATSALSPRRSDGPAATRQPNCGKPCG
jgi:hypothetical protein